MPRHRPLPSSGRTRSFLAATGLALCVVSSSALADEVPGGAIASTLEDPAQDVRETVLSNGLKVLTLEDHATPVVSFQMWVGVGSRDETRYTGLAHLFEHMMFKGSKHIAPEEHAQLIQARGGLLNAYTSRDFTVYFEDVTRESLPLVIELEAERVANLDISESTLESEREVVLEERRLRTEDSPSGRAFEALLALAFKAHPYRWPVIGWRSDVEQSTVEVCRAFFDTFYVPNNILIAIVGDFETDETLAQVRRAFGPLEPRVVPRNPRTEPEQRGMRRTTVHFDVRGPVLMTAWHAPPSGHADAEALDVASQILSGGRSSRLYRALIDDSEQALSASGGYWELADAGVFYASADVRPGADIDRVEALLLGQIAALRDGTVSDRELDKAKRQLEVSLVNGLMTSHSLASRIAFDTEIFGRVRPLAERLDKIQAVTAEDVQRVARRYLVDEALSVVHVVAAPEGERG